MEVVVVVGLHADQLEDLSPRGGERTRELYYVDLFLVVVAPEIGADPAGIKGKALVLGADPLVRVGEFELLGARGGTSQSKLHFWLMGYTADLRYAPHLRAQREFYGVREFVNATPQTVPCFVVKENGLVHPNPPEARQVTVRGAQQSALAPLSVLLVTMIAIPHLRYCGYFCST